MNPSYVGVSTPVIRNPRLFHQNAANSFPLTYPIHSASAHPLNRMYTPNSSLNTTQFQYPSYAPLPPNSQSSSNYYPVYGPKMAPTMPLFSNGIPVLTYSPPISSNGLTLILIAILLLVALDLVIVRPLKQSL